MRRVAIQVVLSAFALQTRAWASERVVFCEPQARENCIAGARRLGDAPPRGWWGSIDDSRIRDGLRTGKVVPLVIYESGPAYDDAVVGLSITERQRAVLRRMEIVSRSVRDGVPGFLREVVREDLLAVISAADSQDGATVEAALDTAVLLSGRSDRLRLASSYEITFNLRESLGKLRAEISEGPLRTAYTKEDDLLAELGMDGRHPTKPLSPGASPERTYFAPRFKTQSIPGELAAEYPEYSWHGGTVLTLRPGETGSPAWKGNLRLMYLDTSAFVRDMGDLTSAQMDRRLTERLKQPPSGELAALLGRLAFGHAVSVRESAAAHRSQDPRSMDKWKQAVALSTRNMRLLLASHPPRSATPLPACVRRLRDDIDLITALAHAASATSRTTLQFDAIETTTGRISNSSGASVARDAGPSDAGHPGVAAKQATEAEQPERYGSEWIGLSRKELEARHGRPTEKRSDRWIYVPHISGCADRIMVEVFTFKNGRVAAVQPQSRQTGKVCTDPK